MGNSQGREARSPQLIDANDPEVMRRLANGENVYGNRQGHSSQANLHLFAHRDREREGPQDEAALAARRETKAEREARRVEKERVARERERQRSMREESVDGGYLVTQGVYTGVEDYNKSIVRTLMIDRRIAPFWPGLDEHSASWAEHQLIAAVHKRPIPEPDEPPERVPTWPPADGPHYLDAGEQLSSPPASNAPIISSHLSSSPASASGLLKGRAKGTPSLPVPAPQGGSQTSLLPREITLPAEPLVNGQRLEVYLYKDAYECPICFLYYPPHLNRTRCCDQPICSECFVQIKRPDPHAPEHHNDSNNPTAQVQIQQEQEADLEGGNLVSEPAQCPYCAQPEFGITFEPPPIRRGLVYANAVSSTPSPMPSPTSSAAPGGRKRAASLPATATTVITTDKVRPEWSNKLATARAHAARRSAAATALHTAAYMMGNRQRRFLPSFGRGSSSRNANSDEGGEGAVNADESGQEGSRVLDINALMRAAAQGTPGQSPAGQRTSSRRTRIEEVEDMMVLEAIRLSLAAEEERRKKEEKERQKEEKKEEKKKAKEDKKAQKEAQKAARKASGSSSNLYGMLGASRSNLTVNSSQQSTFSQESISGTPPGKGKALDRERSNSNPQAAPSPAGASQSADAQAHLERSRANLQPVAEVPSEINRPSHLRNLSNASSTSSLAEPSPGISSVHDPRIPGSAEDSLSTTPSGAAGTEPLLNYASIMDMIEREQRENEAETSNSNNLTESEKTSTSASHQERSQPDISNGNGHASTHAAASKHNVAVMSGPMQNEPLR